MGIDRHAFSGYVWEMPAFPGFSPHAGMFWLSIRRRMVKRDPKRPAQPSTAAVPAAKEGKDKADIAGMVRHQENGHAMNGLKPESLKSR